MEAQNNAAAYTALKTLDRHNELRFDLKSVYPAVLVSTLIDTIMPLEPSCET
jgi:hypothetical protein